MSAISKEQFEQIKAKAEGYKADMTKFLRDLIRILIIRELLGRPGFGPRRNARRTKTRHGRNESNASNYETTEILECSRLTFGRWGRF